MLLSEGLGGPFLPSETPTELSAYAHRNLIHAVDALVVSLRRCITKLRPHGVQLRTLLCNNCCPAILCTLGSLHLHSSGPALPSCPASCCICTTTACTATAIFTSKHNPRKKSRRLDRCMLTPLSSRVPLLQCLFWNPIQPGSSSWGPGPGGSLVINITKHGRHRGSWPFILQQALLYAPSPECIYPCRELAPCPASPLPRSCAASGRSPSSLPFPAHTSSRTSLAREEQGPVQDTEPSMPGQSSRAGGGSQGQAEGSQESPCWGSYGGVEHSPHMAQVWSQSREQFQQEALSRMHSHQAQQAQHQAAHDAFVTQLQAHLAAVRPPQTPLLQVAFLLPSQPAICWRLLHTCRHLPTVAKLLQMSRQVLDLPAILDTPHLEGESTPPHALPLLRFVAGLATIEQLRERGGAALVRAADACGGNGCGSEYASLVFGGVLSLKGAWKLLQAHTAVLADVLLPRAAAATAGDDAGGGDLPEGSGGGEELPRGQEHADVARAGMCSADVVTAVAHALQGVLLRAPRIQVYCSGTGKQYTTVQEVRDWLPHAATQVGGERKLLSAWVHQGCPEIWQLEEEELGEPEL